VGALRDEQGKQIEDGFAFGGCLRETSTGSPRLAAV